MWNLIGKILKYLLYVVVALIAIWVILFIGRTIVNAFTADTPPIAAQDPAAGAIPAPAQGSTAAPAGDFDPEWSYDQLKQWVVSGKDKDEQEKRYWIVVQYGIDNGMVSQPESLSDDYLCNGVFPEFIQWVQHDSCALGQADPNLDWNGSITVTKFDLVAKSRHDWGNLQKVVLWDLPAVRFGQYGDMQATVKYPGSNQEQVCGREFTVVPGMSVKIVNLTHGNHQISFGETNPEHQNECRPVQQ